MYAALSFYSRILMQYGSVLSLKLHFCAQCCIDISLLCDESGISLFINT